MLKPATSVVAFLLVCLSSAKVYALECRDHYFLSIKIPGKSKCEAFHTISTGSGVVSPSTLATIGENPVGLAYNRQLKVHGSLYQQKYNDSWHGSFTGANGNGTLGGGASVHRFTNNNFSQGTDTLVSMGLGAISDTLKSGIGISVRPNVNQVISSNYAEMKSKLTLGGMINPNGTTRLGFTLHDPTTKNEMVAVGTSFKVSEKLFFVVDGTAKYAFSKGLLKPAFGFNLSKLQFSMGANIPIHSLYKEWSQDVVTAGLAFWSGEKFRFISYYNRLELFYLGATIVFN